MKSLKLWLSLAIVAFLGLCASCRTSSTSGNIVSVPAWDGSLKLTAIGLCEDYPEESRSLEAAARDLNVAISNRVSVLRIAFGWDAIEAEPGNFDWSFWDDFVRMAQERNIRLIPYVCYTPGWASSKPGPDAWRSPPKDPELFGKFMRQIVARYKDQITSWELWNEPDNRHYWLGSTDEFRELLRQGSIAVRQTDPTDRVVLGGLAWNLAFLEELATKSALTNVDIVNLHNYYETWSEEPIERLPDYLGRARDILTRNNLDLPLWMAELGYSSFRTNNYVSDQFQAAHDFEHTAAYQASALVRMLTLLLASGHVDLVAWYRINDLPVQQEVIGDVNNRHLGIIGRDGQAKPASQALGFFQSLFGNGYRILRGNSAPWVQLRAGSKAQVYSFATPQHRLVVCAWTQSVVPGERTPASPSEVETLLVKLPSGAAPGASLKVYDAAGRPDPGGRKNNSHRHGGDTLEVALPAGETRIIVFP